MNSLDFQPSKMKTLYSHWKTLLHNNDDIYHPRQEILHNIDPLSDTDGTDKRKFKAGLFLVATK